MSEFNKSKEDIAKSARQVLLPSRYEKPFVEAYQQLSGFEVPEARPRKLKVVSNGTTFRRVRGRDIPKVLNELDTPDAIGLTGYEWYLDAVEGDRDISLGLFRANETILGNVALIASTSVREEPLRQQLLAREIPIDVVSPYPNIAGWLKFRYGYKINLKMCVSGAVEGVADSLGIPAIDLVSTGETIRENDFVVIEPLLESYPALLYKV